MLSLVQKHLPSQPPLQMELPRCLLWVGPCTKRQPLAHVVCVECRSHLACIIQPVPPIQMPSSTASAWTELCPLVAAFRSGLYAAMQATATDAAPPETPWPKVGAVRNPSNLTAVGCLTCLLAWSCELHIERQWQRCAMVQAPAAALDTPPAQADPVVQPICSMPSVPTLDSVSCHAAGDCSGLAATAGGDPPRCFTIRLAIPVRCWCK